MLIRVSVRIIVGIRLWLISGLRLGLRSGLAFGIRVMVRVRIGFKLFKVSRIYHYIKLRKLRIFSYRKFGGLADAVGASSCIDVIHIERAQN